MTNPLFQKLSSLADLSEEDRHAIDRISQNARTFKAGENLIIEGDRPENVFLLLEGWAYRYKIQENGKRQILAFLIPGDLCDIRIFILKTMDHSIGLLSDAKVALVSQAAIVEIMEQRPLLNRALWWATLVDEAILRQWLVSVGARDAYQRMAHLFCEMWVRMGQIDLVQGEQFSLPLTQNELADTLGLTPVHINRTLQRMKKAGLVSLEKKLLRIHASDQLFEIGGFSTNYLHLDRRINGKSS